MTNYIPTEKALFVAFLAIERATREDIVITRATVDEILAEVAQNPEHPFGDANRRTVFIQVRKLAPQYKLPIALTDREEMLMHRTYLRHLNLEQAEILREEVRVIDLVDANFVDAYYTTFWPRSTRTIWTSFSPALKAWGERKANEWIAAHS